MASKRFEYVKGPLNVANDPTAGAFSDPISGQAVPGGGLLLGDTIAITDSEAATLSSPSSSAPLYGGTYRRIRLDAAATSANCVQGKLAFLTTVAKGVSVVTDYSHALATSLCIGVFLNPAGFAITPGNYGWIQVSGTATVLGAATLTGTPAVGTLLGVATGTPGSVDVPTSTTAVTSTTVGVALDLPVAATLFRAQLKELVAVQG